MNSFTLLFSQQGTSNPVLKFDAVPAPDVTCARTATGVYVFGGSDAPDPEKLRLFITAMEVENQGSGDPIRAVCQNQGSLKVLGRDLLNALSDFDMAADVAIPMTLVINP